MAGAIAHIATAFANSLAPVFINKLAGCLHIDAPHADSLAGNTGEIGLTAGPHPEAAIERVIPHVELLLAIGVHRGDEVDGGDRLAIGTRYFVRDIDDVFVGTDAVVLRNGI